MAPAPAYAALFVDFENIFYYLKNHLDAGSDPGDYVVQMIRELRFRLQQRFSEQVIINHAYADFERMEQNAQGALYLIGVEAHNVLGTDHKNAADMRLCIDALETLYTRQEIRTFILVAGDRDYIPVIQHLKKHARTVRVTSFRGSLSGDLLTNVGEEFFLDAAQLLPGGVHLLAPDPRPALPPRPAAPVPPRPQTKAHFEDVSRVSDPETKQALEAMLRHFGDKSEVWMTPYLHKLRAEMPLLAEFERRALVRTLVGVGAIRVEKRKGEPNDYSVILVNWNHPDVRETNPGDIPA